MGSFKLLDSTLRDGGYVNNWIFGCETICNIISNLVDSKVDYLEVGFLKDCQYDVNRTLYNSCQEIKNILPDNYNDTIFTAMVLHNKYDINKLIQCDNKCIKAIRVAFHDYDIAEGLEYIKEVQLKGYKVFINPINIMAYSDDRLLRLIEEINRIKPHAFSIVDTFGSIMKQDLEHIYYIVENNLDRSINIGLHLHENLSLSYSLAQNFIEMATDNREYIIDGSLAGMGRNPGNLNIELIMEYINKTLSSNYNLDAVYDAINDYINPIKSQNHWGYNMVYAMSAKYKVHRNYAEFLLSQSGLKGSQINKMLNTIDDDKKNTFDKDYAEEFLRKCLL